MTDVSLIVEGSYPYVTGGVSTWTQQLIEGLPDVSFSVVHLGEPGTARYARPLNLVEICDLPVDPETGEAAGELPEAAVYHALATGSAGAAAARAAAERGRRFVLSEHGLAWLEARLGIVGCQQGPNNRAAEAPRIEAQARDAYARAFAVTAVCHWNARRQRSLGARAVRVIQNPAALGRPRRSPRLRRRPLVGFVGRVVPVKDVATFLLACRLVADAVPGAHFVVVGPLDQAPGYSQRCRALADDLDLDVEFTGEVDAAAWYPRLDALVLTSRSEAQPLVALEAMAAGVPVVATRAGGCAELLRGCGLLTPVANPAATAAAVVQLLRTPELRARLRAEGRTRVRTAHAPTRMLRAFAELYEAAA